MYFYIFIAKCHETGIIENVQLHTIFVGMSASVSKEENAELFGIGMSAFVPKPVDKSLLRDIINSISTKGVIQTKIKLASQLNPSIPVKAEKCSETEHKTTKNEVKSRGFFRNFHRKVAPVPV